MPAVQNGSSSGGMFHVCETPRHLITPPETPKIFTNPLHAKPMGFHWYPGWAPQPKHPFGGPWDNPTTAFFWGNQHPDREPIQGWYNESDPRIVARSLATIAESGANFVCVNWFHHASTSTFFMEHAVQIMMELPFMPVKFCLGFDPQTNPMPVRDRKDLDIVIARWKTITRSKNYFRYEGKPVLYFGKIEQMESDVAVNAKLSHRDLLTYIKDGIGEDCYIISGGQALPHWTNRAKVCGYSAYSPYNMFHRFLNHDTGTPGPAPTSYAELVANYEYEWQWFINNLQIDFWTMFTAGFDGRPWSKEQIGMGMPTELEAHFRAGLPYLAHEKSKGGIVYAWNETGEGGIMEPSKLLGRQKLDRFKLVFRT